MKQTVRSWNQDIARSEIARLTKPGILGFYTHVEVTEVYATLPDHPQPTNIFTILVAEERQLDYFDEPHNLNPQRIKLAPLKGWVFGINRYGKPIADLMPALDTLGSEGS